ncbi:MAG: hypothetical protein ABJN26_00020 [Stappiaceae bacterium]
MNLEPIIDLVENTQAPYLHYARKVMTAKERKRLLQLLPDDRIVFMDGAKMQTVPDCSKENVAKLGVSTV